MDYLSGFGNHFNSEAIAGSLPEKQNSPQKTAHGLYPEQLSGTAFTAPRLKNQFAWLYRILPSVVQSDYHPIRPLSTAVVSPTPPNQLRWSPLSLPQEQINLFDSLIMMAKNPIGEIYHYACSTTAENTYFYSADGDWLFVPEHGEIIFKTEFGQLEVKPGEIIVIPRGIKWTYQLVEQHARGYLIENQAQAFQLPDLGPIGANGLAQPRHFLYPVAAYEDKQIESTLLCKYNGHLFSATLDHSPLDVVAWHGNYAPYKYDLALFNTINTVSFDHPDPSIFTVLTSQSNTPGVANIDFVIFPERWMVAEHTFRPPYFHRNVMSEYMGLIRGQYDAKQDGFTPGGASLHNCMSPHGPDSDTTARAIDAKLQPERYENTLAFMFESNHIWQVSKAAYQAETLQHDYTQCWRGMKSQFKK